MQVVKNKNRETLYDVYRSKNTIYLVLYSSSVYRPSPRSVCYTVWRYCGLVFFSYHLMVTERLQPQSLCTVVDQLDTA